MKKMLCLTLAIAMICALAACGSGLPAFSAEALTAAQTSVYTAMAGCPVKSGYELKSAAVMLTDDFARSISDKLELETWDLSEVSTAVVVELGKLTPAEGEKQDNTASAEGEAPAAEERYYIYFLLDSANEVIYSQTACAATGMSEAAAAAPDSDLPTDDTELNASSLRRTLAQLELDEEDFIAGLEAEDAKAVADAQQAIEAEPSYLFDADYLISVSKSSAMSSFDQFERERQRLIYRIDVISSSESLDEAQRAANYKKLTDKESSDENRLSISQSLATAKAGRDECYSANKAEIDRFLSQAEELKAENADYLYSEEYLSLCLRSEVLNSYDDYQRQMTTYETSLAAMDERAAAEDESIREYILERSLADTSGMTEYTAALKTYIKNKLAYTDFLTENEKVLKTCDDAMAEIKTTAGENYQEDIEYIKLELKYKELLDSRTALEEEAGESKALAESAKTAWADSLKLIDNNEEARKETLLIDDEKLALTKYLTDAESFAGFTAVSEYEATAEQWGCIHPDYIVYQNEHLQRPITHSGSSSYHSSDKNDDSDGYDYDPNDELYSSHDADGDGKLSDEEFGSAFNDYVGDLYDSYYN